LGIDPGFSNGHKLAVISPFSSSILATGKIYGSSARALTAPPHNSGGNISGGGQGSGVGKSSDPLILLRELCDRHHVQVRGPIIIVYFNVINHIGASLIQITAYLNY
jgi:hypothetical protein